MRKIFKTRQVVFADAVVAVMVVMAMAGVCLFIIALQTPNAYQTRLINSFIVQNVYACVVRDTTSFM